MASFVRRAQSGCVGGGGGGGGFGLVLLVFAWTAQVWGGYAGYVVTMVRIGLSTAAKGPFFADDCKHTHYAMGGVMNGKLCPTSGTFHKQKSSQILRTSDQDMIDESCI